MTAGAKLIMMSLRVLVGEVIVMGPSIRTSTPNALAVIQCSPSCTLIVSIVNKCTNLLKIILDIFYANIRILTDLHP